MNKIIYLVLTIYLLIFLAGCSKQNDDSKYMVDAPSIPNEVNQLELIPDLTFQSKFPFYNAGGMRIWMELENKSLDAISFTNQYYLEIKTDQGWEVPLIDSRKDFGQVDTAGIQFPINSGETREIGLYIGALGIYNDDYGTYRIPTGLYRITMISEAQSKVQGEFEISNDEPEDTRNYSIKTTSDVYDKEVTELSYEVINDTDRELVYGLSFHIEHFVNDKWRLYPMDKDRGFNDIGIICPALSTTEETIQLSDYYKLPFKAGKYRLAKQLDRYMDSYAEFSIE